MVRTHISLSDRHAHLVHLETNLRDVSADVVEFSMPVWTPGSYLVREFARNVLDFSARDGEGTSLAVSKVDKNTWRVETAGASSLTVSYTVYANELSVRTSEVNAEHAFLSPAGLFFQVSDRPEAAHQLSVECPQGWSVFTGLPHSDGSWTASSFDILVDSPLEVGPHETFQFEHDGVPHRVVLAGRSHLDQVQLKQDIAKIVAEVASVFGQMPFDDYTFIMSMVDSGGGGLEHLNSSVCMTNRWEVTKPDKYRGFLSLIAHEYFHAWNVKRFRPEALGPFDYEREVYTRDLWVAEGITSYLDDLSTLRAGFYDKTSRYLDERAEAFRKEAERPGSKRMSMADSSHSAWIKLYRPDENSANSSISYYSKGALVSLMLDLRIRRLTSGQRTIADVLRLGWDRYTTKGVGFPEGAMQELASEIAGDDLGPFFSDYIHGTVPLQPNDDLRWVGMKLEAKPESTERPLDLDEEGFALEAWLGASTSNSGGLCRVDKVVEGGPAWKAGLNHADLILAINGTRASSGNLQDRLDRAGPGEVEISFFRGQSLRTLRVTPERRRLENWKLVPLETLTDEQASAFELWLKSPHPSKQA